MISCAGISKPRVPLFGKYVNTTFTSGHGNQVLGVVVQ